MIARPSCDFWHHALKAESLQIKLADKSLDNADRVLIRDIVFQAIRKQCGLQPLFAFNETLHSDAADRNHSYHINLF